MIENKIDIRKLFLYYVNVFSDSNENGEFSFEKPLFVWWAGWTFWPLKNYPIVSSYNSSGKSLQCFCQVFHWRFWLSFCWSIRSFFIVMRSRVPCQHCGVKCCASGFVFKNVEGKCVCKVCYAASKRTERPGFPEMVSSETQTSGEVPVVFDLNGKVYQ